MDTTAADHSEENTKTQKAQMNLAQPASTEHPFDKLADARKAKKKKKRAKHRAKLRRSHTGG